MGLHQFGCWTRQAGRLAALLVLLAPGPAWAAFGAPFVVSQLSNEAGQSAVAVAADGDALVVWSDEFRVQARARSAAGVLGPIRTLSTLSTSSLIEANDPQVALDGVGNALVTWQEYDGTSSYRIKARAISATGVLGPIQIFSGQNASRPQVAIEPDGDALVVWQVRDGANYRVQARTRSAAGVLGPIQTLSGAGSATNPRVVLDTQGRALVVWENQNGLDFRIFARARSATGLLGPILVLSAASQDAGSPRIALDSGGRALIVWYRFDGANWRIQGRTRSAAGVLSAIQTFSANGASDPRVSVDANGNALVAWVYFDGTIHRIQGRTRSAAGVLGSIQTLSQTGGSASSPQVALGANGKALVVWRRIEGTKMRIQVLYRPQTGSFGTIQTLAATSESVAFPQVSLGASGTALVVWEREVGNNDIIQAAAGP